MLVVWVVVGVVATDGDTIAHKLMWDWDFCCVREQQSQRVLLLG